MRISDGQKPSEDEDGALGLAAYFKTDKDIAHYLEAVFEDGDPALINHALGVIARARGMSQIAKAAGLGREKSLQGAFAGRQPGISPPS